MMKRHPMVLLLAAVLFATMLGCYNDNLGELHPELLLNNSVCDTTTTISYAANVKSILDRSCGTSNSCHGSANNSNIPLQNFNQVKTVAANGTLWASVNWASGAKPMPKNSTSKLDECSLTQIRIWLDEGAPQN